MEEAINSILQSSLVAALLGVGLVLVHRHHMADKKDLKAEIKEKDAIITQNAEDLKEMVKENIAIETRLLDALKILNNGKQ